MLIFRALYKIVSMSKKLEAYTTKHWLNWHWENDYYKKWVKSCTLTSQEKLKIKKLWMPYFKKSGLHFSNVYHDFYKQKSGFFDEKFVPDGLYYACIDRFYNSWNDAKVIDNKCFYNKFFHSATPNIACRQNNTWTSLNGDKLLNEDEILSLISTRNEVVIKEATESEGGHGVHFMHGTQIEEIKNLFKTIRNDIVIQDVIEQHPNIAKLNETSINTIRIITLLRNNDIIPLSAIIRMGIAGSRVDNASSGGGNLWH